MLHQFIKTFVLGITDAFLPRRTSHGMTQIVPRSSVSGRALTAVISIMSFLACLTTGVVFMISQSANAWFNDIASEVTVQVTPRDGDDMEKRIQDISAFMREQPGVRAVRPFTLAESSELLEPWLGKNETLKALPVPRLIAIVIDREQPPDMSLVRERLIERYDGALLDDHRHWQAQIRSLTRSVAIGGIGILLLVAVATAAVVISAARSAMASNHEIVEVLHFVGAKRKFISSEFERHFLALGIRSGLIGAAAAAFTFLIMPYALQLLGGGSVTGTELKRFIGSADLDVTGYMMLVIIVIVVAAICMFTSSYWVERILDTEGSIANPLYFHNGQISVSSKPNGRDSGVKTKNPIRWPRGARIMVKAAITLVVAFLLGFIVFVSTIETEHTMPVVEADAIVVLTGGQSRIEEAVRLLKSGKAKRLLISGVYARTSRKQLAQLVPEGKPLFDCCIDIGRNAQDTIGNAMEARAWASQRGFNSLILVTSGYHMPRSLAEFRRAMPNVELIPYSVQSSNVPMERWWFNGSTLKLLFVEYVKYLPALARLGLERMWNKLVG